MLRNVICTLACIIALAFSCVAFTDSDDATVQRRVEEQIRRYYGVPMSVAVALQPLKASDFPAYDSLTVTFLTNGHTETAEFLLSKDRHTLARLLRFDISKDGYTPTVDLLHINGLPFRGNPTARVTIVVFDDYQCPFCARMHQMLVEDILTTYGARVRIVYKDYPLSGHQWAMRASVDAHCLAAQNVDAFWAFTDYIHMHQKSLTLSHSFIKQYIAIDKVAEAQLRIFRLDRRALQLCISRQQDDEVQASIREGTELNVSSVPTLFVNGRKIEGLIPATELRAVIENALQ
jgi:protein-disulfide isomerase